MTSLAEKSPRLLNEWDSDKNNKMGLNPYNISIGSSKKVWWLCKENHSYSESVYNRVKRNNGCPYCSNHRLLKGFNDFKSRFPEFLKEWDYEKNNNIDLQPDNVICNGSKTKAWWKCDKGHSWFATIRSRVTGHGCPYCSNNMVLKGFNDLETTNPELLKYWNYNKNINDKPDNYTHGSTKKVWWICDKGHEWEAPISSVSRGNRCPYCSNQRVLSGYNDLGTKYPELLDYWDYEKNDVKPNEVSAKTNKSYWWICDKGHSYQQSINSKTRYNIFSCPICNKYKRISIPEKIIYFYIKKYFKDAIENYKADWLGQKEIDIYIPDKNIGIEYDGYRYHRITKEDKDKDLLCTKNEVKLVRIREKSCKKYQSTSIKIYTEKDYSQGYKYLESAIIELGKYLGVTIDVDLDKDLSKVLNIVNIGNKQNCIAMTDSEILDEWDYEKNDEMSITPYNITSGTNLKVWWICPNGHSYKSAINTKIRQKTGCPYCNGRKVLKGYNDLASNCPEVLKEWDYKKNNSINPDNISKWSLKKVWWICPKGHSYQSTISNRIKGCACPYCSGHRVLKGYNDILTIDPTLKEEWDFEKNNKLGFDIHTFTKGNDTKVWWKCDKGHSYFAKINDRVSGRTGCPYCSNHQVLRGFNDLETTNPKILKLWNYKKNNEAGLFPYNFSNGSHIKVWWICDKGHEWESTISALTSGRRCPYCSNNKILKGFNDVATTNPELLKEWDYENNAKENVFPDSISKSYSKKIWWICPKGHSYQSYVYNKRNGYGKCPICKKKKTD